MIPKPLTTTRLSNWPREHNPKLIVAGCSSYSRTLDFPRFRAIADSVGALLMVDMAHISGLVAGGAHPSPVPYAQIVTTTTQKTLRGPRGGMILAEGDLARKIDFAVFPYMQGGPFMHIIAAKAVCFAEALQPEFARYATQVVANAQVMAQELSEAGVRLVAGGTDNHLMLVDLTPWESPAARRNGRSSRLTSSPIRTPSPTTNCRRAPPPACVWVRRLSPAEVWAKTTPGRLPS